MRPQDLLPADLDALLRRPPAEQFPGYRPDQHRFDSPGGTLVHAAVGDAMAAYARSPYVTNDGGAFPQSRFTDRLQAWAHEEVLALLAADGGVTVFGANMTTLTSLFVRAIGERLAPGDEVVCTSLDHEANRHPWATLWRAGVVVRVAEMAPDGTLPVDAVTSLIGPRTRWVAVTAASNVTGAVPDLAAITKAAHAHGAGVFVDAVQATAHRVLDLREVPCDALVTSAYKWYGPHLSVLWLADRIGPDTLRLAEQVPSAGRTGGENLALGTNNHEGLVGLAVAARVLRSWPRDRMAAAERALFARLVAGLRDTAGVRILTPTGDPGGVPVLAFDVAGEEPERTAARLAGHGVAVWHGSFYASAVLRRLSPARPTAVRAGLSAYSTEAAVDALVDALRTRRVPDQGGPFRAEPS
ncbi:aminotransferase class V-fold PLP-dependent enzyme [Actinoplanes sp. NPDC051851]|uniref:aminotransferase class V-fold PLP-dependent enzyme n=1 Tax=Actinoplanes sp. NPDC051851 TaxID=3154753 RepID=UPI0034479341